MGREPWAAFAGFLVAATIGVALLPAGGRRQPPPLPPPPPPPPPPPAVLPDYAPTGRITGSIRSMGSDTMNNLMTLWAEGVMKFHPRIVIEVEGKGSSTAVPALVAGTADLGPMSRPMKAKEIADFERKFGYPPTALATSVDMLAIFVHRENPIRGLTMPQVDAIFSRGRKGGFEKDITRWGDLGLTGEWADREISLYGRNSASGTYGYFKEHALLHGDYKDSVKQRPGSSSVVAGVAADRYAIGYSGIGYKTADVRAVPLARKAGEPFVEAAVENAYSGTYPMARFLFVYVNYKPGSQLDPVRREFLKYVFSRQGQKDVVRDGYYPLPPAMARAQLEKAGIR